MPFHGILLPISSKDNTSHCVCYTSCGRKTFFNLTTQHILFMFHMVKDHSDNNTGSFICTEPKTGDYIQQVRAPAGTRNG